MSCVDNGILENNIPSFSFYMEYDATNKPENKLLLQSVSSNFYYSVTATGIESDISLDTVLPIKEETEFQFKEEGEYSIAVQIYLPDGTFYLEKNLTWIYDSGLTMTPIVGFNESATNDENVSLLVAGSKSPNTVEIWVEGDLHSEEAPEGSWREIPSTNVIPLRVSQGDGFKNFKVKTRNKAKVESEVINLSLLRKGKSPEECYSFIPSITKSRFLKFEISANDSRQLYYRVFGDINNDFQFHEFSGSEQVDLELTEGFGEKKVTIQIRDEAENYCLKDVYEILYDSNYIPGKVTIKDDPIWTDDPQVVINIQQDHLPSDELEMYVFGDIESSEYTDQWLPYSEADIPLVLSPRDGHRWIRAKFRKNGVELPMAWDGVYLKPFIHLRDVAGELQVSTSNIIAMDDMSITGCLESYDHIPYSAIITCSPTGTTVEVEYFLQNGTSIVRSALVP